MIEEKRHGNVLFVISCLVFLAGLAAGFFVLLNLDKIVHWDEMVHLKDASLSVRDWGNGSPTVIIEGGLNQPKFKYILLSFFTSPITRTIAYSHAGIGYSTKSRNPRLLPYYVKELRELMKKKHLKPPYILIGHSSGGFIIRYFTYLYPDEVAGLIFIDTPPTNWFQHIRTDWKAKTIKKYFKWWYPPHPDMNDTGILEKLYYEENCALVRGKKIPANIPVLMFTGNNVRHFRKDAVGYMEDRAAWAAMQGALIKDVHHAKQVIDWKTGHYPFKEAPVMIVSKINDFIKQIKERRQNRIPPKTEPIRAMVASP